MPRLNADQLKAARKLAEKTRPLPRPYSRALRRGVLGVQLDGRSIVGRLARQLERELTAYVGGHPDIATKLMIDRVIKARIQIESYEVKLELGEWTDLDRRVYSSLQNAFRLGLRELKPAESRQHRSKRARSDLQNYLAEIAEGEAET